MEKVPPRIPLPLRARRITPPRRVLHTQLLTHVPHRRLRFSIEHAGVGLAGVHAAGPAAFETQRVLVGTDAVLGGVGDRLDDPGPVVWQTTTAD